MKRTSSNLLIIGHRGSREHSPENTIDSLRDAVSAGADMVELDIRLTSDGVPVLSHDRLLHGSRKLDMQFIRRYSLDELRHRASKMGYKLTTLNEVMDEFFGSVFINIEIKGISSVGPVMDVVRSHTSKQKSLDSLLFSSFNPLALHRLRNEDKNIALGMLHHRNPLAFVGWHRLLRLSAVGFHRLYVNDIALEVAKKFGLFTYVYTVNRPEAALRLEAKGIEAIVTDHPEKMLRELSKTQ